MTDQIIMFISQLFNGLKIGSVYALVALGYTMVYGIIRLINVAHGDFIMVGAYVLMLTIPAIVAMGLPAWVAVIPAVLSILLLGFGLQEPKSAIAHKRSNPLKRENLKKLSAAYWWVVAIGSIFTLARFSEIGQTSGDIGFIFDIDYLLPGLRCHFFHNGPPSDARNRCFSG